MTIRGRRTIQEISALKAQMGAAQSSLDMENRISNLERRFGPSGFVHADVHRINLGPSLNLNQDCEFITDSLDSSQIWACSHLSAAPGTKHLDTYDSATGELINRMDITSYGRAESISPIPGGTHMLVVTNGTSLLKVDMTTYGITAFDLDAQGYGLANCVTCISADGGTAYVACYKYSSDEDGVAYVDTASGTVTDFVTVDAVALGSSNINGLSLSSDGLYLYASSSEEDEVSKIEVLSSTVTATVSGAGFAFAWGLALSPDDDFLYVDTDAGVTKVETSGLTAVADVALDDYAENSGSIAVTPDGRFVFTARADGTVYILQCSTFGDNATRPEDIQIRIENYPITLCMMRDGSKCIVGKEYEGMMHVIANVPYYPLSHQSQWNVPLDYLLARYSLGE